MPPDDQAAVAEAERLLASPATGIGFASGSARVVPEHILRDLIALVRRLQQENDRLVRLQAENAAELDRLRLSATRFLGVIPAWRERQARLEQAEAEVAQLRARLKEISEPSRKVKWLVCPGCGHRLRPGSAHLCPGRSIRGPAVDADA